jgi:hypothetical protein
MASGIVSGNSGLSRLSAPWGNSFLGRLRTRGSSRPGRSELTLILKRVVMTGGFDNG